MGEWSKLANQLTRRSASAKKSSLIMLEKKKEKISCLLPVVYRC